MKFRGQVLQDAWVVKKLGNKRDGFFLDIGANDGIYINNTYYLEKELGWNGICVEADVKACLEMVDNRDCSQINCAVYSHDGLVEFATSDKNRIWGVKDNLQESSGDDITAIACYTIKTILDVFNAPKVIDYISIDIEGADYEALLGFPFDTHEVKLWTIEHNAYLDGGVLKEKIRKLMAEKGYELTSEEDKSDWANIFEDWFINPKYIIQ